MEKSAKCLILSNFQNVPLLGQPHGSRTSGCSCSFLGTIWYWVIAWQTGRATGRTCTSLVQLTSTLFQVPKIQAMLRCLQQRSHPTTSYPTAPFVSQPSNASRRYPSQCKVSNANWSCWTMQTGLTGSYWPLGPCSVLLFPPALLPTDLHKWEQAHTSPLHPHRAVCYQRAASPEQGLLQEISLSPSVFSVVSCCPHFPSSWTLLQPASN